MKDMILKLKSSGWTPEDIASKMGVSCATIYAWQNETRKPSRSAIFMMEDIIKKNIKIKAGE